MSVTAQKHLADNPLAGPGRQTYSVEEFCQAHRICRASFYNICKAGRGPKTMKIGSRTLISVEAAATWRARMEAEG